MYNINCIVVIGVLAISPIAVQCQNDPCKPTQTKNEITTTKCVDPINHIPDNDPNNNDDNIYTFAYPGPYAVIIIIGVLILPLSVCLRICWYRRIKRNRDQAINRNRELEDGHDHDHGSRVAIYFIDNMGETRNFRPQMSPPSYEQSVSDAPPKYEDLPPSYNPCYDDQKVVVTSQSSTTASDNQTHSNQSTSGNSS